MSESTKTQMFAIKHRRYLNSTSHIDALKMAAKESLNTFIKLVKKMLKTLV